jgi:hypothetical protein
MAKPRSNTESRLERLRRLRDEPPSPAVLAELKASLCDSSNHVVAAAARLAGRFRYLELAPELLAAFGRFLDEPLKTDKTCAGKIAVVEALNEMDFPEPDVFVTGARHVQLEPGWPQANDAAVPLRAACAGAIVRTGCHEGMPLLVDLLADPERPVRAAAAQALGAAGSSAALLLLRLKARVGDVDPDVTGECLLGLMRERPQEYAPFLAEFLRPDGGPLAEVALLALGNSRRTEAFGVLKSYWDGQPPRDLVDATLVALALLRLPAAIDFLLTLVAEAPLAEALAALPALAILNYDSRVPERVAAAVGKRGDRGLQDVFKVKFRIREPG